MNAVEMKNITKTYPLVTALDGVDFTLREGEILSLLGENGAGKSTLMNVLYGICHPDTGEIQIFGKTVNISKPKMAIDAGIGMVHQHFMLAPVMTVTENIIAGAEPGTGKFLNRRSSEEKVQELIDRYGFGISAAAKVRDLSLGQQQKVEILKAVFRKVKILILDEPTAVLTPQETEELFQILRKLKSGGTSIILITHKLKETLEIADSVSVLRDGHMIQANVPVAGATAEQLAEMMVGRKIALNKIRRTQKEGPVRLDVRNITLNSPHGTVLDHISFSLRGEVITGIAGIEGNGQTELIECLTGLRQADQFDVTLNEKGLSGDAKSFLANGIGHIPEDRMTRGLVLEMSIEENMILGYHDRFKKHGFLQRDIIRNYAQKLLEEYRIKAPDTTVPCSSLSGGNQQKVVVSRVFSENPDVIIVAQPTRGVDIGASEFIHDQLIRLRDEGKAILLISADLDEVKELSDRLMVLYDGKIVARGVPEDFSDMDLGLLMTGAKQQDGKESER